MKWYIGFGKINKKFRILLLAVLFKILSTLIYGTNNLEYYEESLSIIDYYSILQDEKLFRSVMRFFGITVLSFVYRKIEDKQEKTTDSKNININLNNSEKSDSLESKNETSKFSLIHNEIEVEVDNTKYVPKILTFGLLLVLVELAAQFYNVKAPHDSDFWTFEILFAAYFMRKIFKIKLYKHQIFSMCFIAIFCSLMKCFICLESNNYELSSKLLFIPCYLVILIIKAYAYNKIKWFMDIRYISISQILFIYGLFGFCITLIISILAMIFKFSILSDFINYYFLSYSVDFKGFLLEITLIIAYMFFNFFYKFYYMLTLKTFSLIYVLANNSLYYLIVQIILLIKGGINVRVIIFYVLSNIFSIWSYLIYVELIELKFCGCDYDLKKNITSRSRNDSISDIGVNGEIDETVENIQEW